MGVECAICLKGIEVYPLYEYDEKEMCSDCVSLIAKTKPGYKAERNDEEQEYDQCSICRKWFTYWINGEFNDRYCVKCLGGIEMPRGETYRLALWSRYLDRQDESQDGFYDAKRFR